MNAATALFNEALRTYGQEVLLTRPGGVASVTACVQPAANKDPARSWDHPAPPGLADRGRYLYIGPPGETLHGVTKVSWQGRSFAVVRAETWFLGEAPHHVWALLVLKGGAS